MQNSVRSMLTLHPSLVLLHIYRHKLCLSKTTNVLVLLRINTYKFNQYFLFYDANKDRRTDLRQSYPIATVGVRRQQLRRCIRFTDDRSTDTVQYDALKLHVKFHDVIDQLSAVWSQRTPTAVHSPDSLHVGIHHSFTHSNFPLNYVRKKLFIWLYYYVSLNVQFSIHTAVK